MSRVCLITGASEGFGFALADRFAAAGYELAITARRSDALEAAAAKLRVSHPSRKILPISADCTDVHQVQLVADACRKEFGRIDVLINAVGKSDRGLASELDPEKLDQLWRVNVLSAILCTQAVLPELKASHGSVINIGSLASKFGARWLGGYSAVKHALGGWTQQLRLELAADGVHVLLVCPGPILRSANDSQTASRYADQAKDLPAAAALPAGGARVKGLDPHALADDVLSAMQRRAPELVRPRKARLLQLISAINARWGDALIVKMTSNR